MQGLNVLLNSQTALHKLHVSNCTWRSIMGMDASHCGIVLLQIATTLHEGNIRALDSDLSFHKRHPT